MSENKGDIFDRIDNFDHRWIYLVTWILIMIPIIRPLGIPITVSPYVKGYYAEIEKLEPGDVVMMMSTLNVGGVSEQEAGIIATHKLLMQRDVKVIFFSAGFAAEPLFNEQMEQLKPEENYGKVYGVDYVRLGFNPIDEAAMAALALDISSIYKTDWEGTPIEELPIMSEVKGAKDVDLFVNHQLFETTVRQLVVPYDVPMVTIEMSGVGVTVAPYYPELVKGFLSGAPGGSELEVIGRVPGGGATFNDAKNLSIFGMVFFLVMGNIVYHGRRLRGDKQ